MKRFEIKNKIDSVKNILQILFFVFCFFGVFNFVDAVTVNTTDKDTLRNGLVFHWTMDGKDVVNGVIQDKSGNGNSGQLVNIATSTFYTIGKIGQAFKFDGSNDYITNPTNVVLTGDYTISVWFFNQNAINSNKRLISIGDSTNLIYSHVSTNPSAGSAIGSNSVHCIQNTLSGGLSVARYGLFSPNVWHHVVCNYTGGVLNSMYVDGVETSLSAGNGTWANDAHTGVKLATRGSLATFWNGKLDDFRLYNRNLSVSEIQQLYNLGAGDKINTATKGLPGTGLNSGLVGWWTMDGKDVVNGALQDKSGNGNSGQLINIATSTFYTLGKIGQAFKFDGVNDYVNLGSNAILTAGSPFTISWWEKITGDAGSYPSRFALKMNGTTNYFALTRPKSQASYKTVTWGPAPSAAAIRANSAPTTASSVNIWRHFVLVGNDPNSTTPGDYFLYVDNVSYATSQAGSFVSVPQNRIGYDNVDSPTNATLDDVRIYNRALSASEITQLYNLGAGDKINTATKGIPATGLNSGLVGWWTMDGKDVVNGVLQDKSGNGNSGQLINIATSTFYTLGKIGQAFKFDGSNDRVNMGNVLDQTTNDISISLWYKSTYTGISFLVGKSDNNSTMASPGYRLSTWSSGTLNFQAHDGTNQHSILFSPPISNNKWNHIVISWTRGSYPLLYFNGVLTSCSSNCTGSFLTMGNVSNSNNFVIGARTDGNGSFVRGFVDDVRVYNRALSASEILRLYNMGR